ncbi:o-succinylbenzoate synthase [Flavobacterium sp.]|uniref:o-succinylbenzoate synthase n=1 Tax=Flavobacterium sp. TaxID=239 RepID=UPI002626BFC6|nr:o-succinylbenzoate synthase [Flavobacterium sp.]
MAVTARAYSYFLNFIKPAGTSRGVLLQKESHFILLSDGEKSGIGECGLLRGLSYDDRPNYVSKLNEFCDLVNSGTAISDLDLNDWPSINFGFEIAGKSLKAENPFLLFDNDFSRGTAGIPINGLIWMGSADQMKAEVAAKLNAGFSCLKLKVGALDFDSELAILKEIRAAFSKDTLEIRVDANGAFSKEEATFKLNELAKFDIHSIEQPIKAGQWEEMRKLCSKNILPIALDEELIGLQNTNEVLDFIAPQYAIFKPSFLGGWEATQQWILACENRQIGWWITSALESSIGLNAIAQFTAIHKNIIPQGLGTGALYDNNFDSPLEVKSGFLNFRSTFSWELSDVLRNFEKTAF